MRPYGRSQSEGASVRPRLPEPPLLSPACDRTVVVKPRLPHFAAIWSASSPKDSARTTGPSVGTLSLSLSSETAPETSDSAENLLSSRVSPPPREAQDLTPGDPPWSASLATFIIYRPVKNAAIISPTVPRFECTINGISKACNVFFKRFLTGRPPKVKRTCHRT